jgi:2Fe-2S ferredoxin
MPSITYINNDGATHKITAADGATVMQTALNNGIIGIVGECGGAAMCATCHVYVDEQWASRIPPISDNEDAMLESAAAERKPNSRLSCQIVLSAETDGLVVHLPERQI